MKRFCSILVICAMLLTMLSITAVAVDSHTYVYSLAAGISDTNVAVLSVSVKNSPVTSSGLATLQYDTSKVIAMTNDDGDYSVATDFDAALAFKPVAGFSGVGYQLKTLEGKMMLNWYRTDGIFDATNSTTVARAYFKCQPGVTAADFDVDTFKLVTDTATLSSWNVPTKELGADPSPAILICGNDEFQNQIRYFYRDLQSPLNVEFSYTNSHVFPDPQEPVGPDSQAYILYKSAPTVNGRIDFSLKLNKTVATGGYIALNFDQTKLKLVYNNGGTYEDVTSGTNFNNVVIPNGITFADSAFDVGNGKIFFEWTANEINASENTVKIADFSLALKNGVTEVAFDDKTLRLETNASVWATYGVEYPAQITEGAGGAFSYGNLSNPLAFVVSYPNSTLAGAPDPDVIPPTWTGSVLTATGGNMAANVSWPSAQDNVMLASYELILTNQSTGAVVTISGIEKTLNTYKVKMLEADAVYDVKIYAYDTAGNKSAALTTTVSTSDLFLQMYFKDNVNYNSGLFTTSYPENGTGALNNSSLSGIIPLQSTNGAYVDIVFTAPQDGTYYVSYNYLDFGGAYGGGTRSPRIIVDGDISTAIAPANVLYQNDSSVILQSGTSWGQATWNWLKPQPISLTEGTHVIRLQGISGQDSAFFSYGGFLIANQSVNVGGLTYQGGGYLNVVDFIMPTTEIPTWTLGASLSVNKTGANTVLLSWDAATVENGYVQYTIYSKDEFGNIIDTYYTRNTSYSMAFPDNTNGYFVVEASDGGAGILEAILIAEYVPLPEGIDIIVEAITANASGATFTGLKNITEETKQVVLIVAAYSQDATVLLDCSTAPKTLSPYTPVNESVSLTKDLSEHENVIYRVFIWDNLLDMIPVSYLVD